ncbi:PaaI family thioesterase [Sphingomonas sp. LM7]|uniref:PaaI family thioesterase n=1 Tax=Sphingomonas sp. LM7 TaxID=1938607 RepID=UPI000983BC41|nr:PaaI family thioesterase [Sphingomonas sp. LM7]AQR74719.1 phenylacetic acid degradation protein [Sphingomonas sp. LM7]
MTDSETPPARAFDPRKLFGGRFGGHGGRLGIVYHDSGDDWAELALPYDAALVGDVSSGVIASGPILALMDMAASVAVWLKLDAFKAHATLDLRIDYLRPARPGHTVIGRAECYRITRSIAFVRGQAHDGDPGDPLAHVAGTFMAVEGYR